MKKGIFLILFLGKFAFALPNGFVYLEQIDPSIIQDIRYGSYHNFVGRPIKGYQAPRCILTLPAAAQLKEIQQALKSKHLSLKVYDCYRPQQAVDDFWQWSQVDKSETMKAEFYPRIPKKDLFELGYIARRSMHSQGSTVDLTVVTLPVKEMPVFQIGDKLLACYAPKRFADNSIDMGTGYDCLDLSAHYNYQSLTKSAKTHRALLKQIMEAYGFEPYDKEWWHFSLKNPPFAHQIYNFPVR